MAPGSLVVAGPQPCKGEIYEDTTLGVRKLEIAGDVERLLQNLAGPIELALRDQQAPKVVERDLEPPTVAGCARELDALLVQPLRLVQVALCFGGPGEH